MISLSVKTRRKTGQHILEYALVVALVAAAAAAMFTYLLRAAKGGIKIVEDEALKDPKPAGP